MGVKEKLKHIWNAVFIPTGFEPVKFMLLVENVHSVYRNIGYYKKCHHVWIYIRVVVEIALTIASMASHGTQVFSLSSKINAIYFYMNMINSIIVMILALRFSEKFSKILIFLEHNHTFFANDKEYRRKMIKRDAVIKYGFLISIILVISSFIYVYVSYYRLDIANMHILFVLYGRICNSRCNYQNLVLYSIIYVISEQVDCITRAITKKKTSVAIVNQDTESRLDMKQFEEFYTIFSNIKKSSTLLNEIFGLQLISMLTSATVYCIMFLYTMAFLSVKGDHNIPSLFGNVFRLLASFLLLLMVSWGAQQKQNNVTNLRRQLGNILIDSETNEADYKVIKGFLRLVSTRCISTKTYGSIDVDMTLIPSFIMFVTSYTVIALQFNNVV